MKNRAKSWQDLAKSTRTWSYLLIVLLLVLVVGWFSQAYAQSYLEVEPNNPCGSAQDLLSAVLPLQVAGYKTPDSRDAVDFYRFSGTPGAAMRVTLDGDFSQPNPLTAYGVGFFPSECPMDPSGSAWAIWSGVNLEFLVPSDGIFIIGVTACCDTDFSGSGTLEGGYVLSVASNVPVDPVASISGQVTDKVTGHPLAGNVEPFAWVDLYRSSLNGFEYVSGIPTSEDGKYIFSAGVGTSLPPGDYQVFAYASQYQRTNNSVDLVNVQSHEARVAPVLTLLSNPVRITDVTPCDAIPAGGGICDFSYRVTVGTADLMVGVVWSLVNASGTGGLIDATVFLACEQPLTLIPEKRAASAMVRCQFTVPARVPDYALVCPDARFGEDSRANPHFTVQGLIEPLFCLTKLPRQGSFEVLPQPAAVELLRHKRDHR